MKRQRQRSNRIVAKNESRGRAIKLAALTSILSKFGTILLQLVALPIAVKVLGKEIFGIYTTVLIFGAVLLMAEIGLITSVSRSIAIAVARGRKRDESAILFGGMTLIGSLGLLLIGVVVLVLYLVPLTTLLGEKYVGYETMIYQAIGTALTVGFLDLFLHNIAGARVGYQETHINNAWGAFTNVFCGLLLIFGIRYFPNIPFLILTVYGARVLALAFNGIHLFLKRPYLIENAHLQKKHLKTLLRDGMSFAVANNVVWLGQREGGKLILAHLAGPVAVGTYAVLLQLSIFISGFVYMVSTPLMPAITDAKERGDFDWILVSRWKASYAIVAYGMATLVGLYVLGPWLIDLWMGGEIKVTHPEMFAFGLFQALYMWVHIQWILLSGLGLLKRPALILLWETLFAVIAGFLGCLYFGMFGMMLGMCGVMLVMSVWRFPRILSQKMDLVEMRLNLSEERLVANG